MFPMDEEDWDLHAVVRGCATAVTTATDTSNPRFPSSDQNSFDFLTDDNHNPFHGLQEVCREFYGNVPPPPATISAADIACATSTVSIQNIFQPLHETALIKSPPSQMNNCASSQNFPATNINQSIRQRRRKNHQMKIVRQMTQEELSADSWAWRKYGQKPIKGSPYPRNYYRCSTSKGCAARKQVERSPNDPGIFVVAYTGEHTHPRPAHRSSIAGITRSKFSSPPSAAAVKNNNSNNNERLSHSKGLHISSSSPVRFPPSTPLAAAENNNVEIAEEEDGGGGGGEEDENILMIPNDSMNDVEDLLKGFHDSDDHSSGGGDSFRVVC